jgi:large subunit ribosomal protein L10
MPNFINEAMLSEVKVLVDANPSFILVDPAKLTSSDTLKLRKDLRGVGARMKMAKVAIIQKVIPAPAAKMCDGGRCSIALVLASDMIGASKVIADLAKEDKISVKGGLMDGASLDVAAIKRLADLPSKQTLRGMLVNILAAPLSGLARAIAAIEKKKGGGDAAADATPPAA